MGAATASLGTPALALLSKNSDSAVTAAHFNTPVRKIVFRIAIGTLSGDFDVVWQHTTLKQLLAGDFPKVKVGGLDLIGPKGFGQLFFIMTKLSRLGPSTT